MAIANIDWSSPDKVARYLTDLDALGKKKTATGGRKSVDEDALRQSTHPAAAILLQKRKLDTLKNTFLLPARGMGRVHGVLALNRAATGRTAMSRMNLQNIPKEPALGGELKFRELFGHPDYEWVKMDLVGAELVVIAVESGCELLLQWFSEGRDVHKMMAGRILGKLPEQITEEEKRRLGKVPNFALCYGGGVRTLVNKAREEYGVILEQEEAANIVYEWRKAFPEIIRWHDKVELEIYNNRAITSPMGRVRSVPFLSKHDYNVALNAPIQGTVSDLLLLGLDVAYPWPGELVNIVHDEADLLVPKGTWGECRAQFQEMGIKMAQVSPKFPMRVEIAVGDSWGGPWAEEMKVP